MVNASYLGIDIGSVSLSLALIINEKVSKTYYRRTEGKSIEKVVEILEDIKHEGIHDFHGICVTGSGRERTARALGIAAVNEIKAHAVGSLYFCPNVRTIIEIGGQDSKIIFLKNGEIEESAMNEICAAGTGSFLDEQAKTLEISIEEEFGSLSCKSKNPTNIAGRCAVFAKSDLIHKRQQGYSKEDILMGLCLALARTYISNLGKGKEFQKPILFQGGVAANKGMRKAFEQLLQLGQKELMIPPYFKEMGAIGSALVAKERANKSQQNTKVEELLQKAIDFLKKKNTIAHVPPLIFKKRGHQRIKAKQSGTMHLGVDIGSVSTSIVIMNHDHEFLDGLYLRTGGAPISIIRDAILQLQKNYPLREVVSVGVTGSGRYLVGDFLEADVVINEINAQAEATIEFHPDADTIFEIGGQDSKLIGLANNEIIFFDMNKVCAAGTGSFIEEQLKKLDIDMEEGIKLAFKSENPVDLQNRCTVFMESDIIHHLQQGVPLEDIVSGVMYGVAKNYLEKVVSGQEIGRKIYFQGGVASNHAVVAAMENLTGQKIMVTRYNEFTGAIGAALIASKKAEGKRENPFAHNLSQKEYAFLTFSCDHCANYCEIRKVRVNEKNSYYGSICGKWDFRKKGKKGHDFYQIRKSILYDQLGTQF